MALDLADIALVLVPGDDGAALDVIRRQIEECGSEHVAFLERKRSQAHILYERPPWDASIFTAPVIVLRYSTWRYVFGRLMDSGDSNIILSFDFVSSEQFEIYLDFQDSKASIRFCNGRTLLDGKVFAEGATTDLKNGAKIEIEDIVFKVLKIDASAATESNSGPKIDVHGEQRLSKLKGATMVNLQTNTSPPPAKIFNALPSENLQQDSDSVLRRPATKNPVAHAQTMAFLESISKQPIYSPVNPTMLIPRMRLNSPAQHNSNTVLEGLQKFEDYRRGDFVGKGSYGQVFKHKSGHSDKVFAVKLIAFPETTRAGSEDIDGKMTASFHRKMAYINHEVNILLKANHPFVIRAHQVFRYPEGLAIVMSYFEDGEMGSLAEFPPRGKTWPLPLSDARSISGQILSGVEYLHRLGYLHRDLKPANVLLKNLDPLEVVICDHGFAQESSRATTRGGSGLWSAPECLWGNADSSYELSVDMYSMGVILLWLLGVHADDGEYNNERQYDELFGDKIRKAINTTQSLEETDALTMGQRMAAYHPEKRPTIQACWEMAFFECWEPPPVKEAVHYTTAFESRQVGLKVDKGGYPGNSGLVESIQNANTHHTSRYAKVTTSVLTHSSKGPASLGVQQPARVQKSQSKVPISNNVLNALSRTSLTKDT